jgi:hypothetical protein
MPLKSALAPCEDVRRLRRNDCGEISHMWRAFFLAFGLTLCVIGAECLVVDDFILATRGGSAAEVSGSRDIQPPEWAPWSLLSAGAVTMLYSFTIPQRVKG